MNGKQYVFKFECSRNWDDLATTDNEKIRYCGQCGNNVFSVQNNEELNSNAEKGNCIYFPPLQTAGIPLMPDEFDEL